MVGVMKINEERTPGLGNMGNTCFANSVLQCLTHTPYLQQYCLKSMHSKKCPAQMGQMPLMGNVVGRMSSQVFMRSTTVQQALNNNNFCSLCMVESHIKEVFAERDRGTKFVYPLSAIILIKKVAQGLFEVGRQSDSSEFLLFLLENMIQSSFAYRNNIAFKLQRETIISKVFQGMLERQIICCSCNNMTTIEEAFLDLSLNLAVQFGDYGFSQSSSQTSSVDLLDCICEFFKTDTLDEQNKYHCQSCGRLTKAQTRFRMKHLPSVLIVHMKRFTAMGTKLKTPLNFPQQFSFDSDYLLEESALKEQTHAYQLYAIIVHQGYSAQRGHYYSFIKSVNSPNWFKYDDDTVKPLENLESAALATQKAYILFYQKVSLDKNSQQMPSKVLHPPQPSQLFQAFASPSKKSQGDKQKTKPPHSPADTGRFNNIFDDFQVELTDCSTTQHQPRRKSNGVLALDDPEALLRKPKQVNEKLPIPTPSKIQKKSVAASPSKKKGPNSIQKNQKLRGKPNLKSKASLQKQKHQTPHEKKCLQQLNSFPLNSEERQQSLTALQSSQSNVNISDHQEPVLSLFSPNKSQMPKALSKKMVSTRPRIVLVPKQEKANKQNKNAAKNSKSKKINKVHQKLYLRASNL